MDLRGGLILGVATVPGVVTGTFLSYLAEGDAFRILLGLVVVVLAFVMAVRRFGSDLSVVGTDRRTTYEVNTRAGPALMVCVGFFVGLFGQGGGLILVSIVQLVGFPMLTILGTVRLISLIIGGTRFLSRLAVLQVNFPFGAALAVGTTFGGFFGMRVSTAMRTETLTLMTVGFITFLGILLILTKVL